MEAKKYLEEFAIFCFIWILARRASETESSFPLQKAFSPSSVISISEMSRCGSYLRFNVVFGLFLLLRAVTNWIAAAWYLGSTSVTDLWNLLLGVWCEYSFSFDFDRRERGVLWFFNSLSLPPVTSKVTLPPLFRVFKEFERSVLLIWYIYILSRFLRSLRRLMP